MKRPGSLHSSAPRMARSSASLSERSSRRSAGAACASGSDVTDHHTNRPSSRSRTVDNIRSDIRHAVRQVRRNPGVALIAVLALTLGIGLTTTVFSFVYGVILRGLPFEDSHEIVHIDRTDLARGVE